MGFLGALADVAGGFGEGLLPGVDTGLALRNQKRAEEEDRRRRAREDEQRLLDEQDRLLDDQSKGISRGVVSVAPFRSAPHQPTPSLFDGTPLEAGRDGFTERVSGQLFDGATPRPDPSVASRLEGFNEEIIADQFGGPFAFFDPARKRAFEDEMDPVGARQRQAALMDSDPDLVAAMKEEMTPLYPGRQRSIAGATTLTELKEIAASEEPDAAGRADIAATEELAGQRRRSPRPLSGNSGASAVNSRITRRQAQSAAAVREIQERVEAEALFPDDEDDAARIAEIRDEVTSDFGFGDYKGFQGFNKTTREMLREDDGGSDGGDDGGAGLGEFGSILEDMLAESGSVEAVLKILSDEGLQEQEIEAAAAYLEQRVNGRSR